MKILSRSVEYTHKSNAKIMTTPCWHSFKAHNAQTQYGFGTSHEADAYCAHLNRNRDIHLYAATAVDASDAHSLQLDAGYHDGINLADELHDTIDTICHDYNLGEQVQSAAQAILDDFRSSRPAKENALFALLDDYDVCPDAAAKLSAVIL